jgi:hypothetical protein
MNILNNKSDVIDSRDIIERIKELENELGASYNGDLAIDYQDISFEEWLESSTLSECQELYALRELQRQCIDYADDWEHGETLIRRSYFETYMDEIIEDCYELPKDMPYWMTIKLDYDALEQDYMSVDFDGQEFLIRC